MALWLAVVAWLSASDPVQAKPDKPRQSPAPVRAVTQSVNVEQVRAVLLQYLERQLGSKADEVEVQVLSPLEPFSVPAGSLDLHVIPRGQDRALGKKLFEVGVAVDRKEVETVRVTAEVTARADVVTPVRPIRPDETIEAEDLAVTRIQLPVAMHDFMKDVETVVGKRALRYLQPDQPVRLSALALPYVVKRGDRVTIEAKHGGLLIQAAGLTKAAGSVGQSIAVTNLDSGKEVRARVIGPGVVRVEF
ncbi:MAG: flagellar basal body P-ring formation chaperone FlgA [Nitrospirota bacterium]